MMPALIFDLDGTLVDTVYAHLLSWQRALADAGIPHGIATSGAFRVYRDPIELHASLDELGVIG